MFFRFRGSMREFFGEFSSSPKFGTNRGPNRLAVVGFIWIKHD
jgi:hypothetical protein